MFFKQLLTIKQTKTNQSEKSYLSFIGQMQI